MPRLNATTYSCADHADLDVKTPSGYAERAEWIEEMTKTHTQHICDECLTWRVFIPKSNTNQEKNNP